MESSQITRKRLEKLIFFKDLVISVFNFKSLCPVLTATGSYLKSLAIRDLILVMSVFDIIDR